MSILGGLFFSILSNAATINILNYGAKGDGVTDNAGVIQAAIDKCSNNGGGTVLIPCGKYLTSPLKIKSNVNLHFEHGACLIGTTNMSDYEDAFIPNKGADFAFSALLCAYKQFNISITGDGIIDGQGGHKNFMFGCDSQGGPIRPRLIYFRDCKGIKVEGITLQNAAYHVQAYDKCEDLRIDGVKVYSHANYNNDGLDIDSKNVIVSNCYFDVEDDAICFKSNFEEFCENIVVTNCIMASNCNAIKFGTSSCGGFRNVSVSNCSVFEPSEDNFRHWAKQLKHVTADKTVISGIAIEMVDGGVIDGITISNISMRSVQTPIFIRLGDRKRFSGRLGVLKNININNIVATTESFISSSITGVPGSYVENVNISDVVIHNPGGASVEMASIVVPEQEKYYPENRMFGDVLPASGFYVRHVKNIYFSNIRFESENEDRRPLFIFDDVETAVLNMCSVDGKQNMRPEIRMLNSSDIYVNGSLIDNKKNK